MKNIIITFIISFSSFSYGQENVQNSISQRSIDTNFFGSIKSVYSYFTYISDSLKIGNNIDKIKEDVMYFNRNILGIPFILFDQSGRKIKTISRYKNWIDLRKQPLDDQLATFYIYNSNDIKNKNSIGIDNFPQYPVLNHYLLVKNNTTVKSNIYDGDIYNTVYNYVLDSHKRIIEEKNYNSINMNANLTDKKNLYTVIAYKYDNLGKIIRQDIFPGELGNQMSFNTIGTETPFCSDLHFSYEYNNKNRLRKISLVSCEKVILSEIYSYDSSNNYILSNEKFYSSSLRSFDFVTQKMVIYYDHLGNVIQKDYVKPRENYVIRGFNSVLPEHTYYKYEFDKYNNWNKCYIYMEGKDGPVTAIIERELEYYDSTSASATN